MIFTRLIVRRAVWFGCMFDGPRLQLRHKETVDCNHSEHNSTELYLRSVVTLSVSEIEAPQIFLPRIRSGGSEKRLEIEF